jgi:hypothetical protein
MHPSLYELSDSDDDSIHSLIFRFKQSSLFFTSTNIRPELQLEECVDKELGVLRMISVSNHKLQDSNGYDIKGFDMCSLTQLGCQINNRPRTSSPPLLSIPSSPSPSGSCGFSEVISESSASLELNDNLLEEACQDSGTSLHMYRNTHSLALRPHSVGPLVTSASFDELSNSDSDATIDAVIMRAKLLTRQRRPGGHAILVGEEVVVSSLSSSSNVSSDLESVSERMESCSSDSGSDDSDD